MLPIEEPKPLLTVALSTRIGARAENVWRALTDPQERMLWDERVLGEVALHPSRTLRRRPSQLALSPSPSSASTSTSVSTVQAHTRWRFLLAGIPQVLNDELIATKKLQRALSHLAIGSMKFDQTLTFYTEDDETGPHTRLGMKLIARNHIAVIGECIGRSEVQRVMIEYIDTTLRQVQKYCER